MAEFVQREGGVLPRHYGCSQNKIWVIVSPAHKGTDVVTTAARVQRLVKVEKLVLGNKAPQLLRPSFFKFNWPNVQIPKIVPGEVPAVKITGYSLSSLKEVLF